MEYHWHNQRTKGAGEEDISEGRWENTAPEGEASLLTIVVAPHGRTDGRTSLDGPQSGTTIDSIERFSPTGVI